MRDPIYNFSAGPSMLPPEVINIAREELANWANLGCSVLEISHRSKEFLNVAEEAELNLRDLLNIPDEYKVLFCHGGARAQFSAIPGNIIGHAKSTDYVNSGYWSQSAAKEAEKYCEVRQLNVRFEENDKVCTLPMEEWDISNNAAYLHFCPNETIDGISIDEQPNFGRTTVVADFSSTILSRPIDIRRYGIIYASAQKNVGPAGITIVVIREDLLGSAKHYIPSILNYSVLSETNSMFNTPPTFSWYLSGIVFKWLKEKGGLDEINRINQEKSDLLYRTIDNSDMYRNIVAEENRSRMNVPFFLPDKSMEKIFLDSAVKFGLYGLKGHTITGGVRASLYNAMPMDGVKALVEFMTEFESMYG